MLALSRSVLAPWHVALALAVLGSAAVRARLEADPAAAAESGFLGLLAAAVLVCLAATVERSEKIVAAAAGLVALALWALPAGEIRGWVVTGTLVAGAAALLPAVARRPPPGALVAGAIACQLLVRGDLLLAPALGGRLLVELLLLPAVSALALAALAGREGRLVWLGAAGLVALGGGFSPVLAAAAALLAGAAELRRPRRALAWMVVALAVAGLDASWWSTVWAMPAALLLAARGRPAGRIGGVALAAALAAAGGERGVAAALAEAAWLPLLLPAALGSRREVWADAGSAALLAVAALTALPPAAALAAPLLLLARLVEPPEAALEVATGWSAALLVAAAVAGSYPWLRPRPAAAVLAATDLGFGWHAAAVVVVLFWLLAGLAAGGRRRAALARAAPAAILAGALVVAALPAGQRLLDAPVVLGAQADPVVRPLRRPAGVRAVVVDSLLANSAGLEPATELARLRLVTADGRATERPIRFARESFEWAARRPGLSLPPGPPPWLSWVAPGRSYPAQRYRALLTVAGPGPVERLEIVRAPGLPEGVEMTIVGLEVR